MSDPYRESQASLSCARCGRQMPPGELAACSRGCGVWVAASVAPQALLPDELEPSRLTSWSRERVGCPMCNAQMTLRGRDMTLFQGCDGHGFWIDRETVSQTGLGRAANTAWLDEARARAKTLQAEQEREEREARAAAEQAERERKDAERAERDAAEERERAQRREEADRAARIEPYVRMVRTAIAYSDPLPLANYLLRIENQVAALARQLAELQRTPRS